MPVCPSETILSVSFSTRRPGRSGHRCRATRTAPGLTGMSSTPRAQGAGGLQSPSTVDLRGSCHGRFERLVPCAAHALHMREHGAHRACSLQPVLARCACCTANARSCSRCEHGAHRVLAAACAAGCTCAVRMLHGECAVMFPRLDRCPRADPVFASCTCRSTLLAFCTAWGTFHCQALQ